MKSHVILLIFIFICYCIAININKNDFIEIFSSSHVCKKKGTIFHHDGMNGNGERIMIGTSKNCNETFNFYVDSSMVKLYILIDSLGSGYPTGELYDPSNTEVFPCSDQNIENYGYIASYCDIFNLNGGGRFQYSVSSFDNYPCSLSIFSHTTILSDGGFINDLDDDNVQDNLPINNDGIQKIPIIGEKSYYAFDMTGLNNSYGPQNVTIKTNTGNIYLYDVKKRVNCSTNNYIGPFTCTTNGYNSLIINGKDNNGYDFERFYTFNCKKNGISTTTILPTYFPPPIDKCYNNGTLIKTSTSSFCSCPKYYTGKQCENKLCFNDGTLGPDGECICMNYWSGKFCQNMICSDLSDHDYDTYERAFTFIIRTTSSIVSYKKTILNAAKNILSNYILNNPTYFVKFVIVTVANDEIRYIKEMDNVDEFYDELQNLEYIDSNDCFDSLEKALITALQTDSLLIYTKSPIFIFSDGLSDDSDEIKGQLLNNLVYFEGPIFFILLKSKILNCPIDTSNENYKNLFYITQMSQGLISRVDNENDTFNLVTKIGSSIYDIGTLLQNDFSDSCYYAPKYQTFFIDNSITKFTFIISGNNVNFDIYDTNKMLLLPIDKTFIGDTVILNYNPTTIGNYELEIINSDTGPCQYRIFGTTKYKLLIGVSNEIIDDINYRMTIYNNDYNLVSKIKNFKYPNDTDNLLIESLIWTNDESTGLRKILYGSNGKFRNGCTYHLFFGSWKCLKREMKFYINVMVSDTMGNTIQRTKSGFCAAFNPTPIPPTGCQNGGVEGSNGTCQCSDGYTGNKCQQLICQNDGILKNGYCECRGGYTGKFCQQIQCTDQNIYDNFPLTKKSLTFLLHESMTTRTMVNSLLQYSHQMIQDIHYQNENFISYYQVITFNDNSSKIYVDSTNSNDFINGLQNLSDTLMDDNKYTCNYLNLYEAMQKVLFDQNTSKYGYFYVFINGIPLQNKSTFIEAKNFLELLDIQLNIVEVSGAPCGYSISNSTEMLSLLEIALSTKGSFYNVEPVLSGKVLKTIGSQYSSQMIYENYIEDCHSHDININLPIDSETQTVTINIHGNLINDPIYLPPYNYYTNQYNYSLISNIYNDYAYGNRIDKIIKKCDDNWINYDNYCWLFVNTKVTWEDGKKSCNNNNANLATIYSKDDKIFLQNYIGNSNFWIGLNDIKNNETFVWDQGKLNSSTLTKSSFIDWIPQQPNLKYQCVYNNINENDQTENGWITSDCLDKKYYVCAKHIYDSNHISTNPNNNQLPKGEWNIKLRTFDGSCHIKITSQTNILIYTTFSQNQFDDFGIPGPSQGNDIFNYMLIHSTGLQNILQPNDEGKLIDFMMFPQTNITLIGMGNITERDGCLYQYVSTKFTCPSKNFKMSINGYDKFGYTFQRILQITCSSIVVKGDCKNGGISMDNNCFCSLFWTGNNCDIIQCLYGKPNYNFQKCLCNDGYTGDHCTIAVCTRKNGNNTSQLDNNNKAFILAIDGESIGEMKDVLYNIEEILTKIFDEAEYIKKNKFTRYIGVVFRDSSYIHGNVISNTIDTTNKEYFINSIKNEIFNNPYESKQNINSRLILTAIIKVLSNLTIPPLSQAYVITNSNAEDYNKLEDTLDHISYKYTKIDVIIIGDKTLPGNVSFYDDKINSLFNIAYTSGGHFYQVPNYLSLIDFWNSLLITEIDTYTTTKKFNNHCADTIEYIQISSKSTLLVLDIYTLTESIVKILDPYNNEVKITGEIKTQTNWLILITKPSSQLIPGVWKVKLITNNNNEEFCHISARVLEDNPPHIAFNPDVADDGGRHSDYSIQYTTAGFEKNAIVAGTPFGTLTYVQIHDLTGKELFWSSGLISREKCGFEYITKDLFSCTIPTFVVSINGIDDDGHSFRMIQTIHCNDYKNLQ